MILRSDNGESWKEHTVEQADEILNDVLHDSFEADGKYKTALVTILLDATP